MNATEKKVVKTDMDDVIKTSKAIRDFMANQNMPLDQRKAELQTFGTALVANKNIVSASIVKLSVEKLGKK